MARRRFEQVAVMLLSIVMLMTSTGIVSSLAAVVNESSSAPSTSSTQTETTTIKQEGGSISSPSVEQEGGSIVVIDEGEGTPESPYVISTVEQFLSIGGKVNNTSNANKYFVLANDIDLSAVSGNDFAKNGGSLVGIDKTLASTSANVFIVLDGKGYALKGLDVELAKGSSASIFGVLSEKSVIKNIEIEKPKMKSASAEMADIAFVATENKGTISSVTVTYPVLSADKAQNAAFIAAENYGTISDVTVKASHTNISAASLENHTISATGNVGAVAGLNHGTVSNASAINIGMFIPEADSAVVYGGIAGSNSGSVLNSVSTGNVVGGKAGDSVGGVVGKAVKGVSGADVSSTLVNNYSLVAMSGSASGCGIIGSAGKAEMVKDCFWSGEVSGKDTMFGDFGCGVNEISTRSFILIPQGKKATLSADDVRASAWGKASFELDGEFTVKGEGVTASAKDGSVEITANAEGKAAYATYYAKIMLPANVGSSSVNTLKQYFRVDLLTIAKDAKGDGSAAAPFVVKTANDFNLLKYAPEMNIVLANDISVNSYVSAIKGTVDGNGFTINTAKPLAKAVYGKVKNLNVVVTADISTAVFGKAVGAQLNNVRVAMADGVALKATASNSGILFNRIGAGSALAGVQVKGNIVIAEDKLSAIGAFAGLVDGDKVVISDSGAVADIRADKKVTSADAAIFIGSVSGNEVSIADGYVGGANLADDYAFIASVSGKKLSVSNIYTSLSSAEGAASKLASFSGMDAKQFKEWSFDGGNVGFFTGNGGEFPAELPKIDGIGSDYIVVCDATKLIGTVAVVDGKLTLKVQRAEGVVTVKSIPVTVVNVKTGLSATINISNGLEKDAEGRYMIFSAYDLAYVSENIAELNSASFIMQADVDMADLDFFSPIGSAEVSFKGTFDGNGKTVKNLAVNGNTKVGLFSVLDGATVKNVKFENAKVSAEVGYAGVLAGQVTGNANLSNITVESAKITASDLYAAVVVGSIDGEGTVLVKNVTVKNSSVKSESSYVGAVAGRINANAELEGINVEAFSAEGANYIAGVAGLAQGEISMSNIVVNEAKLNGVSEISGVTAGNASIKNVTVKNSEISTVAISSAYTAGGVSAVFSGTIENATVENTKISAGVAAGIVGKTSADGKLTISGADVIGCEISSAEANTVAAGILGVHNVKGSVAISGAAVDAGTVISGAAVSAGLVGDCSGAESVLSLADSKSLATVNGSMTANAVASAGGVGRIGVSAINNITIARVNVGGVVTGKGAVGGLIGIVKKGTAFSSATPLVSDCIVFAQLDNENADSAALIFGAVEGDVISSANIASAVKGVVLTTFGGMKAYPSAQLNGGYTDMNAGVKPGVKVITSTEEVTINMTSLPKVNGFAFDAETGWVSESEERVSIISSAENSLVIKANRRADIAVVAYYVLDADSDIRVPVNFRVIANVYEELEGEGTAALPYLIRDAYDLESMVNYVDKGAYFVLVEDIVLTDADYDFGGAFYNVGNGVITIGNAEVAFNGHFSGLYNGKVHSITGLRTKGNTFGGLFGATDGAEISDLIINDADISASANAGVLVGRSDNTTIRNVTVNSSKVTTTQAGSVAGGLVGVGSSTIIEDVVLNSVEVATTLDSTSATLETAGGVAGIYDGLVRKAALYDVSVISGTVGGGVIGAVKSEPANVINVYADVQVKAEIAGGVAGRISAPQKLSVNDVTVCGSVEGDGISAGIVGQITSESADDAFNKINRTFVKDTVVTATVAGGSVRAIVVGEVSENIAVDKENKDNDVFSGVFYSSYGNDLGAFGAEKFNAYRNSEYEITDLNSLSYVSGSKTYDTIELTTEFMTLTENSIVINNATGTYKSLVAAGKIFDLVDITSDVDGLVEYNAEKSAVRLTAPAREEAKLVFVYTGGLEIAIGITSEYALQGEGTKEKPYLISSADDFGFMLGNSGEGKFYALTQDISIAGIEGGADFAGNLDGNGYVLYDYTGASLFGRVTGNLANIGFAGFNVTDSKSDSVGAVAGVIDGGSVENCFVIAQINANGKDQDAGILAGRAVNGAVISNCVTSGKVVSKNGFAAGGVVGSAFNAQISCVTSTAYVLGGKSAGGIAGEASYTALSSAIFANMAEAEAAGNIIGTAGENVSLADCYYDFRTARSEAFIGAGSAEESSLKASSTQDLAEMKLNGFVSLGGYPVPKALAQGSSAKFATGVQFATMIIEYLNGAEAGTVYEYTDIVAPEQINSNDIQLDKTSGMKATLLPTVDYAGAKNEIARYSNPLESGLVGVTCTVVDDEKSPLSDKLIGVMLKTKVGAEAESFDFFASIKEQPVSIAAVNLADGVLYVNMHLPEGYGFKVIAVDENGKTLSTSDAANEGIFVDAKGAKRVSLTLSITDEKDDWGERVLWSVIGK